MRIAFLPILDSNNVIEKEMLETPPSRSGCVKSDTKLGTLMCCGHGH